MLPVAYTSLLSAERCQVEVSVKGRSLARRSPTERGVSEYDREASIMRKPRPTTGCRAIKNYNQLAHTAALTVCWNLKIAYSIRLLIPIFF